MDGETLSWLTAWAHKQEALGLGNGTAPFFPRLRTKGMGQERLPRGGRLSVRAVQNLVTRLVRQAGIETERQGPHLLRHTAACRWLRRGLTLAEVRDQLGHADIRTTSIYLHADPREVREKLQGPPRTQAQEIAEALLAKLPEDVREALAAVLAGEGDLRVVRGTAARSPRLGAVQAPSGRFSRRRAARRGRRRQKPPRSRQDAAQRPGRASIVHRTGQGERGA